MFWYGANKNLATSVFSLGWDVLEFRTWEVWLFTHTLRRASCATRLQRATLKRRRLSLTSCKGTDSRCARARCWFHFAHSWMRLWVADARKVTVSRRRETLGGEPRSSSSGLQRAEKIQFNWKILSSPAMAARHSLCLRSWPTILYVGWMRLELLRGHRRSALVTRLWTLNFGTSDK